MTEREIILLGFHSEEMREHDEDESYYYALDIVDGLTFITPSNEEVKNSNWYIEIFNTDPGIRFTEFGEVQALINLLNSRIVKK
jgi:hypothetical protein